MIGKRWYFDPLRPKKIIRQREWIVRIREAPVRSEPTTSSMPIVVAIAEALMIWICM